MGFFNFFKKNKSAGTHTTWSVQKDTQVLIGEPANEPIALKNAISEYLKTQNNVKSVSLVLMQKGREQSLLLVINFTGDKQATFNGIGFIASKHLKKNEFIDMVSADTDFGKSILENHPPFYKRII